MRPTISRARRRGGASGGGGGSTLLATFAATTHTETGGNLDRVTQNGVVGYNRRWVQRAEFTGGSPSGTHGYKVRWGDSVGNVPGGATGGIGEFGLVLPEDYGDELFVEWQQFIPTGTNGPALNLTPGDGLGQFKILRAWPLAPGQSVTDDGQSSYGSDAKMGFSEFSTSGVAATYGFRDWNGGAGATNWPQGGDPWFIAQHPPSETRDALYNNAANRGSWITCRARCKIATADVSDQASPSNGIAQLWINGTLQNGSGSDFRNFPGTGVSRAWRYAYIVGARDVNTYPNECTWLDNIKVYTGGFP